MEQLIDELFNKYFNEKYMEFDWRGDGYIILEKNKDKLIETIFEKLYINKNFSHIILRSQYINYFLLDPKKLSFFASWNSNGCNTRDYSFYKDKSLEELKNLPKQIISLMESSIIGTNYFIYRNEIFRINENVDKDFIYKAKLAFTI